MNSLTHEQAAARHCHLTSTGVLEGLNDSQLADLESMGIYMQYHRELVVADASEIQYFFYIIKGDFEVSKVNAETKKKCVLATIGEGQSFGEMSFLTGAMASANVMANDEVVAWAIPHDSLRQFAQTHPGGVRLSLNIATLLAKRIQEGNTRLMGMTSTLSAYFGVKAWAAEGATMEAPQASEHAEMEIPDEVYDRFARETLGLRPDEPLTEEHRARIRAKIEANEVDIVPWLEQGGSGRRLKVRLKFVEEPSAPAAVAAPAVATAAVAVPRVVRVPQVRARITPAIAYGLRPPSRMARMMSIASYLAIPPLTAMALFYFLPFDSREAIAASPRYQALPMQGLWNWFVFSSSTQSGRIVLKRSEVYTLKLHAPRRVRLLGHLDFPQKPGVTLGVTIKILNRTNGEPIDAPIKVEIPPEGGRVELCAMRLPPGSYIFECACDGVPSGTQAPAVLSVTTRH